MSNTLYTLRVGLDQKDDAAPHLVLYLSTRKVYNHGGYQIDLTQTSSKDALSLTITGISAKPGMHTQALAPARAQINIPMTKGTRKIKITEAEKTDTLTLVVNDESLSLKSEGKGALFGEVSLSYHIPPENLFYVMIYQRRGTKAVDQTADILNDFKSLPKVEKWVPQRGSYLCKNWKYPNRFITYFVMKDAIDWDAVKTIYEKHKSKQDMLITVAVIQDGRQLKNF